MKKKLAALVLAFVTAAALTACGGSGSSSSAGSEEAGAASASSAVSESTAAVSEATEDSTAAEGKILRLGESFAYPSLDVHKDYCGWYTSIYGMSETLFKTNDDLSLSPLLAEGYSVSEDDLTWTISINPYAKFSNGTALTADMAARNLARLAETNERFAYLTDFDISAPDDTTLVITTPEVYPTLLIDLAAPETGIMDLDGTTDFDNAPVYTGPFVVKSFIPEGDVEVVKNENYWNGDVKLDGAVFYYLSDDESKLDAMQSGGIDGYTSVTAAAKQIYAADPDRYTLTEIPATRLQFYVLNENRMDDAVREAVNLLVDCDHIAAYLGGTVTAAVGPFAATAPYGQVTKPAPDAAAAAAVLEGDGYAKNADGFYEKDGQVLTLNVCYYKARSLDTIAVLMEEAFTNAGIKVTLTPEEDPDSTYIATGDFDIALYCMIADKAGDPYYCINALFSAGSRWSIAGFASEECEGLIRKLQYETDPDERAALANQIVQIVIDDNAFGFTGLFNKTTVTAPGVTGIAETCPFDFYGIDKDTDIN